MAGSPSAIGHDVRCIRNSGSLKRALARPVLSRRPAGVLPTLRFGRSWPPWRTGDYAGLKFDGESFVRSSAPPPPPRRGRRVVLRELKDARSLLRNAV